MLVACDDDLHAGPGTTQAGALVTCIDGSPPTLDIDVETQGEVLNVGAVVIDGDRRTLLRLAGPDRGVWSGEFPLGAERVGCTGLEGLAVYVYDVNAFGYAGDTWCGHAEGLAECMDGEAPREFYH